MVYMPGIFTVYLQVSDLERSLSFYRDGLGLEVEWNDGTLAVFRGPGSTAHTLTMRQVGDGAGRGWGDTHRVADDRSSRARRRRRAAIPVRGALPAPPRGRRRPDRHARPRRAQRHPVPRRAIPRRKAASVSLLVSLTALAAGRARGRPPRGHHGVLRAWNR